MDPVYEGFDDAGNIYTTKEPRTKLVDVVYETGTSFTDNLTKKGIENVMVDVYEAIYTSDVAVRSATVAAHTMLMNAKGNSEMGIVYGTRLNHESAVGINWENKRLIDPSNIWTTYFKNKAFR